MCGLKFRRDSKNVWIPLYFWDMLAQWELQWIQIYPMEDSELIQ